MLLTSQLLLFDRLIYYSNLSQVFNCGKFLSINVDGVGVSSMSQMNTRTIIIAFFSEEYLDIYIYAVVLSFDARVLRYFFLSLLLSHHSLQSTKISLFFPNWLLLLFHSRSVSLSLSLGSPRASVKYETSFNSLYKYRPKSRRNEGMRKKNTFFYRSCLIYWAYQQQVNSPFI